MTGKKLWRWVIPLIMLVLVAVAGYLGLSFGTAQKTARQDVVAITAQAVRVVQKTPALELIGSIEGETSALISAKIPGRIAEVLVEEGQAVAAGQQLVRLESVELANAVRISRDALNRAEASYDNIAADYQRYRTLFSQNAISRQQLDDAGTRLRVAETELSSARAALSSAGEQYASAMVVAPVAGAVADRTATTGQVVAAGAPLMKVENIGRVYAVVNIEQKELGVVDAGQAAEITVDAFPGQVFPGKVEVINPVAGSASRMFRVKIKADNPDGRLRPGMFIKARIITGGQIPVLAAPQSAVFQKQGLYYVYVVEGGKVFRRQVEPGQLLGADIEIRDGAAAGTVVAASNANSLKDGDLVRISE